MIERIKNIFSESIQTKIAAADALPEAIEKAGQLLVQCLIGDGNIICCGNGRSAANAEHFTTNMIHRFDKERPGLPAICLSSDACTLTALNSEFNYEELFSKQFKVFAKPNDVLLIFSESGSSSNIIHLAQTALAKRTNIIAVTGKDGGTLGELIGENNVELRAPSYSIARIHETHLLILHCLCDFIDNSLFGEQI